MLIGCLCCRQVQAKEKAEAGRRRAAEEMAAKVSRERERARRDKVRLQNNAANRLAQVGCAHHWDL